jgi:hypothetical protein
MESYSSCDSEELYWVYDIFDSEYTGGIPLAEIVWIGRLATAGRREDVLESMLCGANPDYGLCGACYGGHKELALLMIEKGATNMNAGLEMACIGGHKELATLMIEKGATECRL